MKKIILSLVCIIIATSASMVKAQNSRWGVVAGATITNLHFKQDLFGTDQSLGYSAGVKGDLALGSIGFGVDAALLYTQRGATLHLGDRKIWASEGYGVERSYLHYMELPIHLRYKYQSLNGIENIIAPFVYLGPSFSFLLGHSDIPALEYAKMAVSLQFGLGAEIKKKIHVYACYDMGVTYALKTKLLDNMSARNRGWKISVAYYFD